MSDWPQIRYVMAECSNECNDPECPYTHRGTWYVPALNEHFLSEHEARVALSKMAES